MPVPSNFCTPTRLSILLAATVAAGLGLPPRAAVAQQPYYYQPAPDYYHNDTASGTVTGGALGAITGALIGGRGNRGEGALVGAGIGAITGNLMGRSKDRADERHAAAGATAVAQANQQAAARAVTNADLVSMTRAGLGDDLIVSTMRSRGTRLDLGPQSLIALKQSGVSDQVVLAAQNLGDSNQYVPGAAAVVSEPPPAVIVTPEPYPYYRYRYYDYYGPRYYHCRPGFHFHGRW